MTGTDLKAARHQANWTQEEAALKLGLTQAYLSMVESGRRAVSAYLRLRALEVFDLPPTSLPLESEGTLLLGEGELKSNLGALGYPGFGYLRGKPKHNPVQLLFYSLNQSDLDVRVVEAFPWLAYTYVDMDWNWLVDNVKRHTRQNRLGFVLTLAGELATRSGDTTRFGKLNFYQKVLDRSRLVMEDTLCHDSMTKAERKWLEHHRSPEARHWNLLTDLEVKNLAYA
jgi:transcriptional regulator with XRE-family HTH domain